LHRPRGAATEIEAGDHCSGQRHADDDAEVQRQAPVRRHHFAHGLQQREIQCRPVGGQV
jgi:hypothetical protein